MEENRFIQAIEKLAPNLGHVKTYLVVKLGHSKDPIKGITRKNMRQKNIYPTCFCKIPIPQVCPFNFYIPDLTVVDIEKFGQKFEILQYFLIILR